MWNLFCFHMLEEPPVLLRITYRDHSFKTFRCCGSPDSLPFPLAACSQPVISSHSLASCSLSPPPSSWFCQWVSLHKTDECLRAGNVPVVLGGNFLQHSRPTVYICHSQFTPLFEASSGVWGEPFCVFARRSKKSNLYPVVVQLCPQWAHIFILRKSLKYNSIFFLDD